MIDNERLRTELRFLPSGDRAIIAYVRCERITDFDIPALTGDITALTTAHGPRLVVDMSEVLLMGSSGISLLIGTTLGSIADGDAA